MKNVMAGVGVALLGVASYIAVHSTMHPTEHHPAWWLVATVFGVGLALASPATAKLLLGKATDFLPWKK